MFSRLLRNFGKETHGPYYLDLTENGIILLAELFFKLIIYIQ